MKNLDVNALTMGEIATVEKLSGQSIADIGDDGQPMGNMFAALAMVAQRRNGFPGFKWGDALGLTMGEVSEILGLEDEDEDSEVTAGLDDPGASDDKALSAPKASRKTKATSPPTD